MKSTIIVHGGAGLWGSTPRLQEARQACRAAATAGQAILQKGGTSIEAAETAVRLLEDCPALDAGRGSYPNAAGNVEMDAFMMHGRTLDIGAIAGVTLLLNPITVARYVMTESPHNFFVGAGAEAFAESKGITRCTLADLVPQNEPTAGPLGDTVGVVAYDSFGDIVVATSTGGTRQKQPGRVGDTPLVGSGAYADNHTGGVCATGHGESLMKIVISKQICDYMQMGLSAMAASEAAVALLAKRVQGSGGVIALSATGDVGFAFNTEGMPYAYGCDDGEIVVGS